MGYNKDALSLHELTQVTALSSTDLLMVETATDTVAISFADLTKNASAVYYGFRKDPNTGHLMLDVYQATGDYTATIHNEWFIGPANLTFTINLSGDLVVTI